MMTPTILMTRMTSTSPLVKIADALNQGWHPIKKWYHPEVREHFKRRFEKGKEEAIETLYNENTKRPPPPTKW